MIRGSWGPTSGMWAKWSWLTVLSGMALLLCITQGPGCHAAVMGIDLGTQFIKVALVKPGKPFSIVLDETSKRKSPAIVAFDSDQRVYGNGAVSLASKKPELAYLWLKPFLGKPMTKSDKRVRQTLDLGYLPYDVIPVKERGRTVAFRQGGEVGEPLVYSVEELMAMNLKYIRDIVEKEAEGVEVRDAVITVPPFFSYAEKQALYDAASLAGINVISLIHDNTAAAVQYGIHLNYVSEQKRIVCFYDMGALSTKVSIVEYSSYVKSITKKTNTTIGQIEIRSLAFDESLGGFAFDMRLVELFATEFQQQLKSKGVTLDVRATPKVMAKLRAHATKIKEILSANTMHPVQIEGLHEDYDFKMNVKRDEFYNLSKDLLDRVASPVQRALDAASLAIKDLNSFVLVGGSTRIPAVQSMLKSSLGLTDLDQNLNADEAMALGASFAAANRSAAFRVRPTGLIERMPYPVGVRVKGLGTNHSDAWTKRASVFAQGSPVEAKKAISFTYDQDMMLTFQYEDVAKYLPLVTEPSITQYNITGLTSFAEKFKEFGPPKVQLTFMTLLDGMPQLIKAEASVTEHVEVKEAFVPSPKFTAESTSDKKDDVDELSKHDAKTSAADSGPQSSDESSPSTGDESVPGTDIDLPTAQPTDKGVPLSPPKQRKKKHTVKLDISAFPGGAIRGLNKTELDASKERLSLLDKADAFVRSTAEAFNALESFIYSTRSRLSDADVEAVSTDEQRDLLSTQLSAAEDWLYEDGDEPASPAKYKTRLAELKILSDPIMFRVKEAVSRPKALKKLDSAINFTKNTLQRVRENMSWIHESQSTALDRVLNESVAWLLKKQEEQALKLVHEVPAFSSSELITKEKVLVKQATRLLAIPKPRPKPTSKKNKTKESTGDSGENEDDRDARDHKTQSDDPSNVSPNAEDQGDAGQEQKLPKRDEADLKSEL